MSLIRKLGVALVCCVIPFLLQAQGTDKQAAGPKQLQAIMGMAITKSGPASVRMWGYDTLAAVRTSAQFTGVVVKGGYILTAAHVTIPGNTYKVMFQDGRECIAKALGKIEFSDDKTRPDVALMKIVTKGNWPEAPIGSSATLKPFAPCISIAYPESLNQPSPTVRFGYVSVPLVERGFIKSTCIMEPGDSGGPLFDIEGRVIGLHSAIETAESDNYDVPVDLYKKYWKALNKVLVYHALPDDVDEIMADSSHADILTIPQLSNMPNFIGHQRKFNNACLTVSSTLNGKQETVVGTLISLHKLKSSKLVGEVIIVSKNSMVGDGITVTDGKSKGKAIVVRRDRINDLVILRPIINLRGGLKLVDFINDTSSKIHPGSFLISTIPDTTPVISVLSSYQLSLPKISSAGFSGVTVAHNSGSATIYFVRPGSPSAKSDVNVGDIVTSINNSPIRTSIDYAAAMLKYWPGDTILLRFDRKSEVITKQLVLSYPPQVKFNHPAENFNGGKSIRRDGFQDVYLHDAILKPSQCGGPVYDIDGRCVGFNIARFSRSCSVILPIDVLRKLIN